MNGLAAIQDFVCKIICQAVEIPEDVLNSDCGYLKELRNKYARLLVKNPSAFSNAPSKEVDMEQFDRKITDIVNSPVEFKNATVSSVSNDVSPPAPITQ